MNEFFGSSRRMQQVVVIMVVTAVAALMMAQVFGFLVSSSFLSTITLGLLLFITLSTSMGQLRLESQIEVLGQRVSQGDPNTVFKSAELNSAFVDLVSEGSVDLLIVAYDLVGLLVTESHILIQALNRRVRTRIVLPDPRDNDLLKYIPPIVRSGSDLEALQKNIEYSLAQLRKIQDVAGSNVGNIEIRFSRAPFAMTGVQVDPSYSNGTLLISIPTASSHQVSSYAYFTLRNRTSSELFKLFSASFEAQWEASVPYEPEA